ncbi:sigma-70 family RNA polymerase sigma factor [Chamaesiphon sp. VAR_48_metabat_135_sub]|uniref:sigma-70 family RNA polymerase sigma factor n=1 Tax=Chamaesiphon sp. VAR_48_metabat_135_sub TaxID=2964699 RepID=UPI00286AAF18|nr:sigma-70 family RNA polymerase sigma factor [Chamaesiphon sp. VAR_48_metabat_135_sub]
MSQIHPDPTDADLIANLRQGSQHALSVLYDRYGSLVYSLALKLLDRRDEAEDLTQDVFLSFWKQEKFDPNRARLSSYLCLLTRSRAIDKLRSRQSEKTSLQRWQQNIIPETNLPTLLDSVSLAEEQIIVRKSLASLSDRQRQIIELSYYQDLSQSAIATQLNLPLGTVKTHMRQGLIKLRQLLQSQIG